MDKYAVIDLDCNYIKLSIYEMNNNGNFICIEEQLETIKFSEDIERDGLILKSRINEAITIIKCLNKIIQAHEVNNTFANISSSMEGAQNLRSFAEEIRSLTAINFRLLEVSDEMEKAYITVTNTLDVPKGIIVNIESTKTQIIMYNRKQIIQSASFDFGEDNLNSLLTDEGAYDIIEEKVNSCLSTCEWLKTIDEDMQFVGMGDAFVKLTKFAKKIKRYPFEQEHNYNLTIADIRVVLDLLKDMTSDKPKKIKGISNSNSHSMYCSACILQAVYNHLHLDSLIVCKYDISDGFMYSISMQQKEVSGIQDVLGNSLQTINEFYDKDNRNDVIYELSMLLYRQLRVLHKLSRVFARVLRIASYMYSCGARINYENKEKNSYQIIINSDILGASHREIVLAAFIVSSQNLEDFNMSEWVKYKDILVEEDLEAVRKLAIILRIAQCFDKSKSYVIKDLNCDTLGDSVILKTIIEGDATLEIREALKVQTDFKKAFNYNLEVL